MNAGPVLLHILEDDPLVARTLTQALAEHGFRSLWFRTAHQLFETLRQEPPALAVVDLGLPDRDGLDVVRELQQKCDCGVLILTGRSFVSDRILGLELGADDYVVKPFEPRELVARIRSILRRRGRYVARHERRRTACFEGWRFDTASFTLTDPEGCEEVLSATESRMLAVLLERPSRVLTREQLAGNDNLAPYDRSIDVRVSRLRRKLRDDPHNPHLIKTVYGAGYLLAAAVTWEDG